MKVASNMDAVVRFSCNSSNKHDKIYFQAPISDATVQAFLAMPRHLFVRRDRERASKTGASQRRKSAPTLKHAVRITRSSEGRNLTRQMCCDSRREPTAIPPERRGRSNWPYAVSQPRAGSVLENYDLT